MNKRIHGGTDEYGPMPFDFSSNANAVGPCPFALLKVQGADPQPYPDPHYVQLRKALATLHQVDAERILIAGSASEFIQRVTAWQSLAGSRHYYVPRHAYGDYAYTAQVWGMQQVQDMTQADLVWLCNPSSPLGQAEPPDMNRMHGMVMLDCAYQPLCLDREGGLVLPQYDSLWQLWSPNKALGMTGVRAAYAIAPAGATSIVQALGNMAPSWVIGTHGQAMLDAWATPEAQAWLAESRCVLQQWKRDLLDCLHQHGWETSPSITPFFCARAPGPLNEALLRSHGIKLRDATSFGLPGWWRLCAQKPEGLSALSQVISDMQRKLS